MSEILGPKRDTKLIYLKDANPAGPFNSLDCKWCGYTEAWHSSPSGGCIAEKYRKPRKGEEGVATRELVPLLTSYTPSEPPPPLPAHKKEKTFVPPRF